MQTKHTHLVEGHGEGSGDGESLSVLELALDRGEVANGEILGLPRQVYMRLLLAGILSCCCCEGTGGGRRLREAAARARGQQQQQEYADGAAAVALLAIVGTPVITADGLGLPMSLMGLLATGRPAAARARRAGAHGRRRHRSAPPSSPHLQQPKQSLDSCASFCISRHWCIRDEDEVDTHMGEVQLIGAVIWKQVKGIVKTVVQPR